MKYITISANSEEFEVQIDDSGCISEQTLRKAVLVEDNVPLSLMMVIDGKKRCLSFKNEVGFVIPEGFQNAKFVVRWDEDRRSRPSTPNTAESNNWQQTSPYNIQKPLPTPEKLKEFFFYILEDAGTKSCVVCVACYYFVTFRHGSHFKYESGMQLDVYSEADNKSKHTATVAYISKRLDFVLLKSANKIVEFGPRCADVTPGEKILVAGYGNSFQTLSYLNGCIHTKELQYFRGIEIDHIGPFMLGTVPTSRGDSGASCWSSKGLVGLNLGATIMPSQPHSVAIAEAAIFHPKNYMVPINTIIAAVKECQIDEAEKEQEKPKKPEKSAAFVINIEGLGQFESVDKIL